MKAYILLITAMLLATFLPSNAIATVQEQEIIEYEGSRYYTYYQ